jgi:hypothetical protein
MEQKYYVAKEGDICLSLTTHPGKLTEQDIIDNLRRMMRVEAKQNGEEEPDWRETLRAANDLYWENVDRMIQLARPGEELIPLESLQLTEEDLNNELWEMSLSQWMEWTFNESDWD